MHWSALLLGSSLLLRVCLPSASFGVFVYIGFVSVGNLFATLLSHVLHVATTLALTQVDGRLSVYALSTCLRGATVRSATLSAAEEKWRKFGALSDGLGPRIIDNMMTVFVTVCFYVAIGRLYS